MAPIKKKCFSVPFCWKSICKFHYRSISAILGYRRTKNFFSNVSNWFEGLPISSASIRHHRQIGAQFIPKSSLPTERIFRFRSVSFSNIYNLIVKFHFYLRILNMAIERKCLIFSLEKNEKVFFILVYSSLSSLLFFFFKKASRVNKAETRAVCLFIGSKIVRSDFGQRYYVWRTCGHASRSADLFKRK